MFSPIRRLAVITAAACLMLAASPTSAQLPGNLGDAVGANQPVAQAKLLNALKQVPVDADIALIIPDLALIDERAAMLNEKLGLGMPELNDLVNSMKGPAGIGGGMNDRGSVIVIASGLIDSIERNDPQPPMVVLVPVTDYGQFIGNWGGEPTPDAQQVINPMGQAVTAKQVGDYAVLSPSADLVKNYQPGGAAERLMARGGEVGRHAMLNSHILMLVNIEGMSGKLLPKVKEMRQMMNQQMAGAPARPGAPLALAEKIINLYMDALDAVVRDGQMAVLGIDVDEAGIGLTKAVQFRAGSESAKVFKGGGESSSLLASLPDQPYMYATAMNLKAMNITPVLDRIKGALGEANDPFAQMMVQGIETYRDVDGMAQAYFAPQAGAGMASLMNSVTVIKTDDVAATRKNIRESIENLGEAMKAANEAAGPGAPQIMMTSQYSPSAMKISGVDVDQYAVSMTLPPELMQTQVAPMLMMMGLTNQQGYLAGKDGHVIMTQGADAQMLTQTLASVGQGGGIGSGPDSTISQLRKNHLPGNVVYEGYFDVGTTARSVMTMLMGGPNQQMQVPENLAPLATTMSVQNGGMEGRVYVPMGVITAVKKIAEPLMPMLMGGGPGGPRGGGGNVPPPAPR